MRNIDLFYNAAMSNDNSLFARDGFKDALATVPKVRMQQTADYLDAIGEIDESDIPTIAPPWHSFYFEYRVKRIPNSNQRIDDFNLNVSGVVKSAKGDFGSTVLIYFITSSFNSANSLNCIALDLDTNGARKLNKDGKIEMRVIPVSGPLQSLPFETPKMFDAVMAPLLLALSFCHCKTQVQMQTEEVPEKLFHKQVAENKVPVERWHILNIEPVKRMLKEYSRANNVTDKMALHLCRGHFMDYRDGKGLFGKYKGIYWQPQHFKGKAKNGVVNKDYSV